MIQHFLSLSSFSSSSLEALLDRAQYFFDFHQQLSNQPDKRTAQLSTLNHKVLANVFYEPSTRTKCSFEIAAKRLGAQVINFVPENSSVKKGETVYDTIKTFEALGVDGIILRHSDDMIFEELKGAIRSPLINAGAGKFEHPSQGLLDLLTLKQEFGKLTGLKVAVCGDIKHSRVAGSLMVAAQKLGLEVYLCGPDSLLPDITAKTSEYIKKAPFDDVIPEVDALIMLRIQLERHVDLELDQKAYHQQFGLTLARVNRLKAHAIFMHPGPFNREVEIASEVVEHDRSRIYQQINNGVYARMAILEWALMGDSK